MKPAPMPWIRCGPGGPPDSTALSSGSTAIIRRPGLRGFSTEPTPVKVPPVPTPLTTTSTAPSVSFQISSAVVRRWISGFAGLRNCCGMNASGRELTISSALAIAPRIPCAAGVSSSSAPSSLQHLAALERHAVGHRQDQPIALCGTDKSQGDPGIARGRFDQNRAGLDPAGGFGGGDHRDPDAVLDRGERVEELAFAQDVGLGPGVLREAVDANEGSGADRFSDVVINAAAKLGARAAHPHSCCPCGFSHSLQISKSPHSALRPTMPARWARPHSSSKVNASSRCIISSCSSTHSGRTTWWPSALPAGSLIGSSAVSSPAHRSDDVAKADPTPLPRQSIAAARATDPEQDLVAHQLLQHRLEIAARDALALGDLRRAHRHLSAVVGDVEHRLDREQ